MSVSAPAAFDELNRLRILGEALRGSIEEPSSRASVLLALDAVIGFVDSHATFQESGLSAPLQALQVALHDLEDGAVAPFLVPAPCENRHPEPRAKKITKAYAVVCVDFLKSKGLSVAQASKEVASALERAGYHVEGKRDSTGWKTVKNWRDGNSKLSSRDQDHSIVSELRLETPFPSDLSPEEAKSHVAMLLERMVKLVGRYGLD